MAGKLDVLLLVGGAWYHDQPEHREVLSSLFSSAFALTMTDSPGLLMPEALAQFDVIANYTSFWEPSQEQCTALLQAVQGGKGLVVMHPATATFFNCPEYLEMVGGEFVMHDPFKQFKVQLGDHKSRERRLERQGLAVLRAPHPIIAGLQDFEVEDELFYIQGDQTQWNILARAEGHPVVFTKGWGAGRVLNIALGHDDRSLTHPTVRELHIRGTTWVGRRL